MKKRSIMLLTVCLFTGILGGCADKNASVAEEKTEINAVAENNSEEKSEEQWKEENNKEEKNTIVDMRGVTVELPENLDRVAIIDKGFLVQTMTALGVADKIVASGDVIQGATEASERDSLLLCPQLLELPQIGYPTSAVDYETLVGADPDIVILRNSEYIKDSEITAEAIEKIENELHIPLVVVNGPGCYDEATVEQQYEGIRLMGDLFDKEDRAEEIVSMMDETISMIKERTAEIPEDERPSVMFLGGLTGEELSGTVWGSNYGDAKFAEEIGNIKNVHPECEAIRKVSAEQLIALNPDKIVLCTVCPDPDTFLTDPLYSPLVDITAVKNKDVVSRGALTWWGDFRLEVPTIMLISAKGVYPEYFSDINVGEWLNEYHMKLYNLTEEEAQKIKIAQQLDWMDKENF